MNQLAGYISRIIFTAIIYFVLKYFAKDKKNSIDISFQFMGLS